MKRYIIVILALSSLAITACKKYLDPDSPSVFDDEYVFATVDDAKRAVNGVYALFNTDAFTSRLSNNFTGNSDVEVGGVNASTGGARNDIWSFEPSTTNSDVLTVWTNAYNAINRANLCINGIQNSALYQTKDAAMMQVLGEALTLRAYWYYVLTNFWGDVPFRVTPADPREELSLLKTDRKEILSQVIKDLIEIEPSMQWAKDLDYGIERINRDFVIGLIARLSLCRGGYALYPGMKLERPTDYLSYYEIANTYAKKLRDAQMHTLIDFEKVFLNQCEYLSPKDGDILYEVAFQPGFGDVAWCNGVRVDQGNHPYGSGSNYLSFPPTYYHSFDTLDKRLPATCSMVRYDGNLNQLPVPYNSIAPNKWSRLRLKTPPGSASAKGTGINWPMMRYADVLLMLAESENELNGPNNEALQALREVRQRAFAPADWSEKVEAYISAVASNKESFFEAIVNERAWEFGGECIRKYDLIRWGNYGEKIAETRKMLTEWGQMANEGSGDLPDVMYYKVNSDKTVSFLNKYSRVVPPLNIKDKPNIGDNPDGFIEQSWLKGLYDTKTEGPSTFILYSWRGYTDNSGSSPVRYILPLHSSTIASSNGTLANDYSY